MVLAPDVSEADKVVEELTAQIQMGGATEGVVYYQHLYTRNRKLDDKAEPESDSNKMQGFEPLTNYPILGTEENGNESENEAKEHSSPEKESPSKVNEEEELRLRKELLRKRMKEWEDSSSDEEKSRAGNPRVTAVLQNDKRESSASKVGQSRRDSARSDRKKSRSRSRSGGRSRRGDSSKRRGRSRSRSRDRRRSRSRSRDRGRYNRRSRRSRSRSRSRSTSRRRDRRR